ncbi:hypothetical protein F5Y07DRAFT_265256 [Xylaria sp. FL0933]|nr:hypothetical protein F5Y07DRAFT_265256 [Xylaria sp. FL0933]
MAGPTTASVYNGNQPAKPPHKFSGLGPGDESLAQERLQSYISTRNGGGDPVTALGMRDQTPLSSMSERHAEVLRSLAYNTIKLQKGNNSEA